MSGVYEGPAQVRRSNGYATAREMSVAQCERDMSRGVSIESAINQHRMRMKAAYDEFMSMPGGR